jgi:hypothetical protein
MISEKLSQNKPRMSYASDGLGHEDEYDAHDGSGGGGSSSHHGGHAHHAHHHGGHAHHHGGHDSGGGYM